MNFTLTEIASTRRPRPLKMPVILKVHKFIKHAKIKLILDPYTTNNKIEQVKLKRAKVPGSENKPAGLINELDNSPPNLLAPILEFPSEIIPTKSNFISPKYHAKSCITKKPKWVYQTVRIALPHLDFSNLELAIKINNNQPNKRGKCRATLLFSKLLKSKTTHPYVNKSDVATRLLCEYFLFNSNNNTDPKTLHIAKPIDS